MFSYIKQFGTTLLGGFALGITLTWLADIPWRFVVTLAIFLLILKILIEQYKGQGTVISVLKELALLMAGLVMFVGLRASVGYFLDMPISQGYNDVFSASPNLARDIVLEFLFLGPGISIAYLVLKKGAFWRGTMVIASAFFLACLIWTIKQKPHAEAMKRQTQALVGLNARGLNNKALINEAAAITSFGVAKEKIGVFYKLDGTNIVWNQAITSVVQQGQRVLQLHPNQQPIAFEAQAFTEVVLPNFNGSFVGGTKAWVEAWKFNWTDGKNPVASVKVRRPTLDKVVHFRPGQPTNTGLMVELGDTVKYLDPTAPLKVPGKNEFHIISTTTEHESTGLGNIVIYGHEKEGFVRIMVEPKN